MAVILQKIHLTAARSYVSEVDVNVRKPLMKISRHYPNVRNQPSQIFIPKHKTLTCRLEATISSKKVSRDYEY
ncbi:hypothetical protein PMG11_11166 [Penicillium brasilianum]|uniref:Uncharacterized protein n=1 Tax=Penicillium brasilianum TaxID=104259 RepID=A0A0F7U5E9_PENBI|nr:hypothetical protein PMG11_11166 [Penicillium brasilianum]